MKSSVLAWMVGVAMLVTGCSGENPVSPSGLPGAGGGPAAGTTSLLGAATGAGGRAAAVATQGLGADLSRQLSAVKQATARFHSLDQGMAAGWNFLFGDCYTSPDGNMGFHYVNPALAFDGGALDPLRPEVLLYERRGNDTPILVGVEYVVLLTDSATPPSLFGQEFHENESDGVWMLHVWLWQPNPSGMFAHYNPRVSCPS